MKFKILILALVAVAFVSAKEASAGILGRIFCGRSCATCSTCNYQTTVMPCEAVQTVEEPTPCEQVQTVEEKAAVPEASCNGTCAVRGTQVTRVRTVQRRAYRPVCNGACFF